MAAAKSLQMPDVLLIHLGLTLLRSVLLFEGVVLTLLMGRVVNIRLDANTCFMNEFV